MRFPLTVEFNFSITEGLSYIALFNDLFECCIVGLLEFESLNSIDDVAVCVAMQETGTSESQIKFVM